MSAHFEEMYKEYKAVLNKPTSPPGDYRGPSLPSLPPSGGLGEGIIGAAIYVLSGRSDIMNYTTVPIKN